LKNKPSGNPAVVSISENFFINMQAYQASIKKFNVKIYLRNSGGREFDGFRAK
jgi:hypothetical protein